MKSLFSIHSIMQTQAVRILLLAVLAGGVYLQTLTGEFIWDDTGLIIKNIEHVESAGDFTVFFTRTPFESAPYYRPVLWVSFFIDYMLWGRNPLGFHITNIFLHALVTVLVYRLLNVLAVPEALCFTTAALFAVHPINTEAIAWIAGRNDPLMFLFVVLTSIFAVRARMQKDRSKKAVLLIAAALSYLTALLTKESAVIVVPLLLLIEGHHVATGRSVPVRQTLLLYSTLFGITVLFLSIQQSVLSNRISDLSFQPDPRSLFTPSIIYIYYLKTLCIPINLTVDPSFYLKAVTDGTARVACAAVFGAVVAMVFLCRRRWYEGFAGMVWMLVYLVPVSGIVWMGVPILEHRAYGACAGFCYALASLWHRSIRSRDGTEKKSASLATFLFCCIIIAYALLTLHRNLAWRDEFSIWTDTIKKSPTSPQALINLGVTYLRHNQPEKALEYFNKTLVVAPRSTQVYNNMGTALYALGRYDEAIQAQERALQLDPRSAEAYSNLGILYKHRGDFDKAAAFFEKAISLKPTFLVPYIHLTFIHADAGRFDEALTILARGLDVLPKSSSLYNAKGVVYEKMKRYEDALKCYQKAADIDPGNYEALNNLVLCLIRDKKFHQALPVALLATKLCHDSPELFLNLGIIYMNIGKLLEASTAYKKAIRLNERYADAYFNLGVCLFGMKGKEKESIKYFEKVLEIQPDYPNKELILKITEKLKKMP